MRREFVSGQQIDQCESPPLPESGLRLAHWVPMGERPAGWPGKRKRSGKAAAQADEPDAWEGSERAKNHRSRGRHQPSADVGAARMLVLRMATKWQTKGNVKY